MLAIRLKKKDVLGKMKKIYLLILMATSLMMGACTTNVAVDSGVSPVANYDGITGVFYGKLSGSINTIFKATNLALEKDLKYFRVGQVPGDNSWRIYARAELDKAIVVSLEQLPQELVSLEITVGDGDIVKSQELFNAIAKNAKEFTRRQ